VRDHVRQRLSACPVDRPTPHDELFLLRPAGVLFEEVGKEISWCPTIHARDPPKRVSSLLPSLCSSYSLFLPENLLLGLSFSADSRVSCVFDLVLGTALSFHLLGGIPAFCSHSCGCNRFLLFAFPDELVRGSPLRYVDFEFDLGANHRRVFCQSGGLCR